METHHYLLEGMHMQKNLDILFCRFMNHTLQGHGEEDWFFIPSFIWLFAFGTFEFTKGFSFSVALSNPSMYVIYAKINMLTLIYWRLLPSFWIYRKQETPWNSTLNLVNIMLAQINNIPTSWRELKHQIVTHLHSPEAGPSTHYPQHWRTNLERTKQLFSSPSTMPIFMSF